jgi:hypothetical protein
MMKSNPNRNRPKARKSSPANNISALIPFTKGVPATSLKIQGNPAKYTTTVTTGVIAVSTAIQAALCSNFSTRFQAFDEYRIIKAIFSAYPCSSNNPGSIVMWVEPLSNATPTSSLAATNTVTTFSAGGNSKVTTLSYRPVDYAYLDWTPVTTSTSPVGYLNVYTDNANFASSTTATDYCVIRATLTFQFRGYA